MKLSKPFIYPQSRKLRREELHSVYQALRKAFGHQHWWPGETPFEVIVGAILTQNTAWTNVEKAIINLKENGKLNPESLRRIAERGLAKLIRPAGYFNVKANRLKHFIRFLYSEYQGRVERLRAERGDALRQKLLAVKGIGPETADSILLYAAQKPYFVIDAYTKRVFARHRLLPRRHSYDAWQRLFQKALPASVSLYNDFHAQIVAVGKRYCRTQPDCANCPLHPFLS